MNLLTKFRELFPLNRLNADVLKRLTGNVPLFLGCSGGSDSLFLLYLLKAHFPDNPLYVLHFNHRTRAASDEEEFDVQQHAEFLRCEIFIGRRSVKHPTSEAELREERYNFFLKILRKLKGQYLLLAHQADDVIETLFMRLFHGSGLTGLSAPRPVQAFSDGHVRLRPLLNISKNEIQNTLKTLDISWVEDATNQDPEIGFRNRIRLQLAPFLDKLIQDRDWRKSILRSHYLLEEEDLAADFIIDTLYPVLPSNNLSFDLLKNYPRAHYRRLLWRWLIQANLFSFTPPGPGIEYLLERIFKNEDCMISLGKHEKLVFRNNILTHEIILKLNDFPHWPPLVLSSRRKEKIFFPTRKCLTIEPMILDDARKRDIVNGLYSSMEMVFLENLERCIVRQWKNGDRYQPIGCSGSKKLKKLFNEHKIEVESKHTLPIVCHPDGRIAWCPGLPPSEIFKVRQHSTECVCLTYR